MRSALALLCLTGILTIAACTDAPLAPSLQTGISGTRLQADKVVQLVYTQEPEAQITRLPYHGGNITPAVTRMRARWPQLKPYLEEGAVGIGSRGLLSLREPKGGDAALPELLRHENTDRTALYVASRGDVGHGDDQRDNWTPTTELIFAEAWTAQAPEGWWVQDTYGKWQRKQTPAQAPAPQPAPILPSASQR
ncbi:MAG: hypothetical protein JWN73_4741 [Betaproteobacteria bacterium]|nr:hypothetical protein [Betaproteobacteria bacterium]